MAIKYSWLPDVLRLKGSVRYIPCCTMRIFEHLEQIVPRIVGPVLTVTIFATAAAYAWSKGYDISLTNSVVPLLSVVVSTAHVTLLFRAVSQMLPLGRPDSRIQVSRVTIEVRESHQTVPLSNAEMGAHPDRPIVSTITCSSYS